MSLNSKSLYTFLLTYFAYFSLYLCRKPLSIAKPLIQQEYGFCSKIWLSIIDNCHLVPYSFVAIVFPNIVDRLGGRLSLTFTFGGAGVVMILFYFTGLISNLTISFSSICIVTFIGGCLQAFGWPSTIKALSEAIEAQTRNGLIPL